MGRRLTPMNADRPCVFISVYRRSSAAICSFSRYVAAAVFLLVTASAQGAITLDSPREYQVFQRETKDAGKIVVRGRAAEGCDAAEAAIKRRWHRLRVASGCLFDGVLAAPAGGGDTLAVRLRRKRRITAGFSVAHRGIGRGVLVSGPTQSTKHSRELHSPRSKKERPL